MGGIVRRAAAIIGDVVRGMPRNAAGVAGELRQPILRQIPRRQSLVAQIVEQALGTAILDAVEPGHDAILRFPAQRLAAPCGSAPLRRPG
jgi:hypothetical protein